MLTKETLKEVIISQREFLNKSEQGTLREEGKEIKEEEEGEEVERDELYSRAVELVTTTGQASISMIQRRLRVGYNRAARMIEMMEEDGIGSPPNGSKGREVIFRRRME